MHSNKLIFTEKHCMFSRFSRRQICFPWHHTCFLRQHDHERKNKWKIWHGRALRLKRYRVRVFGLVHLPTQLQPPAYFHPSIHLSVHPFQWYSLSRGVIWNTTPPPHSDSNILSSPRGVCLPPPPLRRAVLEDKKAMRVGVVKVLLVSTTQLALDEYLRLFR